MLVGAGTSRAKALSDRYRLRRPLRGDPQIICPEARLFSANRCQYFGCVAFWCHIVPNLANHPVLANPIRHAHDPEERFAEEAFHPSRAKRFNHLKFRIGQQRKIQLVLHLEFRLRFHRIRAAAQNRGIFRFKLLDGVTKLGRFVDSAGSIRFRIEKQNHVLAVIFPKRYFLAFVRRHLKRRRLVALFQHFRCLRFRRHHTLRFREHAF